MPSYVTNDANAAVLAEYSTAAHDQPDRGELRENLHARARRRRRRCRHRSSAASSTSATTSPLARSATSIVDDNGALCKCGRNGCLEAVVSAPLLAQRLSGVGDDDRARFLDQAGRHLGIALATLVGALDLSEIVLSGPMDLLDDRFRTAALETIRHRTFPAVGQHVTARFSSLGDDGVLLGAAALVRSLGVVERVGASSRPEPAPSARTQSRGDSMKLKRARCHAGGADHDASRPAGPTEERLGGDHAAATPHRAGRTDARHRRTDDGRARHGGAGSDHPPVAQRRRHSRRRSSTTRSPSSTRSTPMSRSKFERQQWTGIVEKLTTSLSSSDSPDVVELGNTQAQAFEAAGALHGPHRQEGRPRRRRPAAEPGRGRHLRRQVLRRAVLRRRPRHASTARTSSRSPASRSRRPSTRCSPPARS